MIRLLFVNDLPNDGLQRQACRSHTATVNHQRRRQKLKLEGSRADVHGSWTTQWLPLSSPTSSSDSSKASRDEERGKTFAIELDAVLPCIIRQPPPSLALGPNSAPSASTEGHQYISYYLNNTISKCTLVYPAFNISSIYSIDWVPILTDRLVYHALAAYLLAATGQTMSEPSNAMLVNRGKALKAVRGHLADVVAGREEAVSPNAMLAVTMLGCLEERLGDRESHCMHRTMVGRMMEHNGGAKSMYYNPQLSVVNEMEMTWALESGYTVLPSRPMSRCRRMRSVTTAKETEGWHNKTMPAGFRALDAEGRLSVDLAWTVVHVVNNLQGRGKEKKRETALRKFSYYLDAFPYLHVSYASALKLEELLEMAILQFCSHTIWPRRPGIMSHIVSRKMLTINLPIYLAKHQKTMPNCEKRAILWMWLLTLYAWEKPTLDPKAETAQALSTLPSTIAATLNDEDVETALGDFLWTEEFIAFGKGRWKLLSDNANAPSL